MLKYSQDDTIAAPATPIGEGGIGIVRISGVKALDIADRIFVSKDGGKPSSYETHTVHYGHVVKSVVRSPQSTDYIVDEVLLTVMRAPKSYTREDTVEINCHGGIQAVKNVLDLVVKRGARIAQPGEFTKRAFLNGRIDLVQAQAVLDIIRARTEGSLKAAMGQLEGGLSADITDMLETLTDIAAGIEASIDFPDEELDIIKEGALAKKVDEVLDKMKHLIETFDGGVILREGVLAVICGKPNVGKSSLMNLLLKRDRVIVAPIPGTTRDAVEETISLNGVPIRLVDTAGIGEAKDALYEASADRSRRYIAKADIILLMLDASTEIDEEDLSIIKLAGNKKKLFIMNKTDLDVRCAPNSDMVPLIKVSVGKRKNIEALEKSIFDIVWSGKYDQAEGSIVTNARHKELLDKAFDNVLSVSRAVKGAMHPELIAVELKEAIFNLGLIVGKSVSDDILDKIFEKFCIGK